MRYHVGIDLGSTTTKALILAENGEILGRGITNSRSNYKVACEVALNEALINARFGLVSAELDGAGLSPEAKRAALAELERGFRKHQYLRQLHIFNELVRAQLADGYGSAVRSAAAVILDLMESEVDELYAATAVRRSDFFRDLAGGRYMEIAEEQALEQRVSFDQLAGLFDKVILAVENRPSAAADFDTLLGAAMSRLEHPHEAIPAAVDRAAKVGLEPAGSVGTGYGRQTLPFPKEQIRSEILCHGLGAHFMFGETRTVLDIGGQDTKAIQVDERGIVTSFQMNDRCAAGCGRYLGYIADEMNLGVHQLGPLALKSRRTVRINSTCTVFAGAELRERLSLGEKREDILAGLHRAIILRALSLLARSGGVRDQFTFTGGVAKNQAAVKALRKLIEENYGDIDMNISPDSIYTGALGAALFARRDATKTATQPGGSA